MVDSLSKSAKDLIAQVTAKDGSSGTGGDLEFQDFVRVLAPFAPKAPGDTKMRFAFQVYDFDGDGKLGRGDLTELMRVLLPEEAEEELIEYVVNMAISESDQDGDGCLSYAEFRHATANSNLKAKLTINF